MVHIDATENTKEDLNSPSINKIQPEDDCEKADSGMDDGSNTGSLDAGENSDDDDIVSRKPTKSIQRILDDESDADSDQNEVSDKNNDSDENDDDKNENVVDDVKKDDVSQENKPVDEEIANEIEEKDASKNIKSKTSKKKEKEGYTAEEALEAVMNDSSDDDGGPSQTTSAKKKKVRRPVSDNSSSDEGEHDTLLASIKKSAKKNGMSDIFDTEETSCQGNDTDENSTTEKKLSSNKIPDNLFDNEEKSDNDSSGSSSGGSSSGSDSEGGGRRSSGRSSGDEGFDESKLDPKLLAKLKKGAAKKPPREKSKRLKNQSDVTSIHSETQRMVRESRVNLPYHQPAPKSINDFLARANKKQQEYKNLKGIKHSSSKAKVLQEILEKTRIQSKPKTQEDHDKYSDSSDEDWDPTVEKEKSLKERLEERNKETAEETCVESNGKKDDDSKMETGEVTGKIDSEKCEKIDDNDSLPDITDSIEDRLLSVSQNKDSDNTKNIEISESLNGKTDVEGAPQTDMYSATLDSDSENKGKDTDNDDVLFEWEKNADNVTDNIEEISKENNAMESEINSKTCSENSENVDPNIITPVTPSQKSQKQKTSPGQSTKKQNRAKLLALAGIDLDNVTPCLSGQLESVISLVEAEEAPKNPGVLKLMDRLQQHSKKREKKHPKDMELSIISKDKTGMDKEELKLNTFTYHVTEEEINPLSKLDTPGAKLLALKEQLNEKIRAKRELARQKRQEVYDMDNEEGGYDGEMEDEMSEHSDTDVEDDDYEKQFGEDEEEIVEDDLEQGENEADKEENPFADDEAEEDDVSDGGESEEDMKLKLDVSDEEQELEEDDTESRAKNTEASDNDTDEDKSDAAEFKEPKVSEKPFSMFGSKRRENSLTETQFQSGQKTTSSFPLSIEDSQDLYGHSNTIPDILETQAPRTQQSQSQNFNFFLEDSQSNMLDADGYLRTNKKSAPDPASLGIDDITSTQASMGELLGLCSGRFAGTQATNKEKVSRKSLFDESSASQGGNMEELMGLCSGVFNEPKVDKKQGTKRKVSNDSDDDSIAALSDNEARESDKDESDNEGVDEIDGDQGDQASDQGDTDHLDSGEEEGEEVQEQFTGFTVKSKHGKIRQEFVEEEAELSGSEFDSDEDLDVPEEEDIMMIEEGDKDVANMDQDKLRDEVGRVHLKQLIDEDKRELLRYQEMYLADGDLHSEGGGRMRRFKWNNIDDDTQGDMFGDGSDGEPEQEDNDEMEWRKERFEREKFLKEQQEKENNEGENSQFLKLGKVFLKKQVSLDSSTSSKDKVATTNNKTDTSAAGDTPGFPGSFYKLSKQKRGSFLARSKEALAKIAEMTKPVANPSAGAKTGGKFTFQVISPDKSRETEGAPKTRQRKAHVPNQKVADTKTLKPPAKKPKLDNTNKSFTNKSIFNHL